jgi:maltose O-acetyltransferase
LRRLRRVWPVLVEEVWWVRPHVWLMNVLAHVLPIGVGPRLRPMVYRAFGMRIGSNTTIFGPLRFVWYGNVAGNVRIGRNCFINRDVSLDPSGAITIGDGVVIGQEVAVITAGHSIAGPGHRAGIYRPEPVRVGDGAWIAARAMLLPGVTVGHGAIVAAGAVVAADVAANVLVGGVPARVLRELTEEDRPAGA